MPRNSLKTYAIWLHPALIMLLHAQDFTYAAPIGSKHDLSIHGVTAASKEPPLIGISSSQESWDEMTDGASARPLSLMRAPLILNRALPAPVGSSQAPSPPPQSPQSPGHSPQSPHLSHSSTSASQAALDPMSMGGVINKETDEFIGPHLGHNSSPHKSPPVIDTTLKGAIPLHDGHPLSPTDSQASGLHKDAAPLAKPAAPAVDHSAQKHRPKLKLKIETKPSSNTGHTSGDVHHTSGGSAGPHATHPKLEVGSGIDPGSSSPMHLPPPLSPQEKSALHGQTGGNPDKQTGNTGVSSSKTPTSAKSADLQKGWLTVNSDGTTTSPGAG
ncbi:hypothetical protein CVT24_003477 [Panaeolus cyanescens]|uniref:Uncharacterized protein n=1 Tax=Panaeolus cyanescens TaxID=181874 RepID=A0A409Y7T0_9AGAR|nr:hypothetical protein CVT24_003477 [Panaeolus cyanescens]